MKTLDWYIIKKFLGTFFLTIGIVMLLAVVFDVSEQIEDFLRNEAPLGAIMFDYYLNFIAYFGNLFSAFLIFLAVMIFTARMAARSEVIAMLSAGIKFSRILRPYFIASTFLVILSLILNHLVLPTANYNRLMFEDLYIRNAFRLDGNDFHYEFDPGQLVYFHSFDHKSNHGNQFTMEHWEDRRLTYKLIAERARFDTASQRWLLSDYEERLFVPRIADSLNLQGSEITALAVPRDEIRTGKDLDTLLNFKPEDLGKRLSFSSAMNYTELNNYIEQERAKGSDKIAFLEIEKHQRTSYPFATYVLTLIGVAISCRKLRGGIGMHIALGFVVVFSYLFFMKITSVAATNIGLDAMIAVWIPNIFFFGVGLLLLKFTPK